MAADLEDQMLRWTEFLIAETTYTVGLENPSNSESITNDMASRVLEIWAGIFEGNFTWPIVQCIGKSLRLFADLVVDC